MHRSRHRGLHPEDEARFGPGALAALRAAAEEVTWLLGRGYPMSSAVLAAGNHHQLDARQRVALTRGCCADAQRDERARRALVAGALAGREVHVDGFNLVITLEVALGGGVLIRSHDGCLRDLAGLRGSYHPVEETGPALELVGAMLGALAPAQTRWYLDSAVSNSGRLRARILEHAGRWSVPTTVDLVPDPDPILATLGAVVTSDALILDRCSSWANLAAWTVADHAPSARIVPLSDTPPVR